jgi:hypothetical protein
MTFIAAVPLIPLVLIDDGVGVFAYRFSGKFGDNFNPTLKLGDFCINGGAVAEVFLAARQPGDEFGAACSHAVLYFKEPRFYIILSK